MTLVNDSQNKNGLISVSFNQDQSCIAVALESGFSIFNSHPLKLKSKREFAEGIGMVEMLHKCNYLALVGGGKNPKFPSNKVMIWDDIKSKCVIELEFRTEVKAVKLRRDRIVVVLENKVFVYTFTQSPQRLHVFETCENPKGLCALSSGENTAILVIPSQKPGGILIINLGNPKDTKETVAHESALSCIAINAEGTLVATTSQKGTLVRIFDATKATSLLQLRRGTDTAVINSINFNKDSSLICVSSDKGTIHVFHVKDHNKNKQSSLASAKDFLPSYFSSNWSFAKFTVSESKSICGFIDSNKVIAICADGSAFNFSISENGETTQENYSQFLKPADE